MCIGFSLYLMQRIANEDDHNRISLTSREKTKELPPLRSVYARLTWLYSPRPAPYTESMGETAEEKALENADRGDKQFNKERYLRALLRTGDAKLAEAEAGISTVSAWRYRKDEDFRARLKEHADRIHEFILERRLQIAQNGKDGVALEAMRDLNNQMDKFLGLLPSADRQPVNLLILVQQLTGNPLAQPALKLLNGHANGHDKPDRSE